jgi:Flp pilus assembly protein TadD, contains TPR repeats
MEPETENINQDICVICKEKEKDYRESKNSQMCKSCREKHQKLNIPHKIKLFLIAILILFVLSTNKLPSIISDYKIYKEAENHMEAKEYTLAYNKYKSLLDKNDKSLTLVFETTEAAMRAQYFTEFYDLYDKYIAEKELSDAQYEKSVEYVNLLDLYVETYNEIEKLYEELEDELSTENPEEAWEQLVNSLKELLKNEELDKTLIYYRLSSISADFKDSLNYMKLASENDSRFTYPYAYYGNMIRFSGDLEGARNIYNLALEKNANDALSIRGLGILELLEDNKKEALKKVQYAYELEPYYDSYIAETLVITLYENNLKEEADAMLKEMKDNEFIIESDFQGYLDGTITIKEYFVGEVE